MSNALFEIEGFPQLQAKIKQLPDKIKKREMLKILRAVAKPTVQAAKAEAPVGEREHKRYSKRDGGVIATYQPGNLKKSIGNITGKRGMARVNAVIYVGPRSKGRKNDGYYGGMVHGGTKFQKANKFMDRAFNRTQGQVTEDAAAKTAAYIQKQINKLST